MEGLLPGKRVALFVADLFEDIEAYYPLFRLSEEGAEVVVAGPSTGTYRGKKGLTIEAGASIDDAAGEAFDALLLPGGYAPDRLRRQQALLEEVREADRSGIPVAAICHAGWVLVSAGVLPGRRVTGYWAIRDDLVNAGAEFVDQEVVRDGSLITSRYPPDLGPFCKAVIAALAEGGEGSRG